MSSGGPVDAQENRAFEIDLPAASLRATARRLNVVCRRRFPTRDGKPGKRTFLAVDESGAPSFREVAGFVRVCGRHVDVAPKFVAAGAPDWRASLSAMLETGGPRAAREVAVLPGAVGSGITQAGFLEPVAAWFASALHAALDEHPLWTYERRRQEHAFVRGRLLLARQLAKLPHEQTRVSCDFSRQTVDNPLVGLLRWAATDLRRRSASLSTRRLLHTAVERLPPGPLGRPARQPATRLPPGASAYADLLALARDLYAGNARATDSGGRRSHGLVIRTAPFFEAFVSGLMRDWAARSQDRSSERQQTFDLAVFRSQAEREEERSGVNPRQSKPDDVLRLGKRVALVSDAKYKGSWHKDDHDLGREDLYQVISACLASGCGRGLVVRPAVAGSPRTGWETWVVDSTLLTEKIILGVVWLDLTWTDRKTWRQSLREQLGAGIEAVVAAS